MPGRMSIYAREAQAAAAASRARAADRHADGSPGAHAHTRDRLSLSADISLGGDAITPRRKEAETGAAARFPLPLPKRPVICAASRDAAPPIAYFNTTPIASDMTIPPDGAHACRPTEMPNRACHYHASAELFTPAKLFNALERFDDMAWQRAGARAIVTFVGIEMFIQPVSGFYISPFLMPPTRHRRDARRGRHFTTR